MINKNKFNIKDYLEGGAHEEFSEKYLTNFMNDMIASGKFDAMEVLHYISNVNNIKKLIPFIHLENIGFKPAKVYGIVKNSRNEILTAKTINKGEEIPEYDLPVDIIFVFEIDEDFNYKLVSIIRKEKKEKTPTAVEYEVINKTNHSKVKNVTALYNFFLNKYDNDVEKAKDLMLAFYGTKIK